MAKALNYYQLLNLDAKSRQDHLSSLAVKQAYRRALLQYHPDKKSKEDPITDISIDDIALAYKTLSDPALRAEYDAWLISSDDAGSESVRVARPRHTGLESVDLDDLEFDSAAMSWSRGCRCGSVKGFTVSEPELEVHVDEGEIIVGCKGCSLWLRILFGVEE